jgi:predicted permease
VQEVDKSIVLVVVVDVLITIGGDNISSNCYLYNKFLIIYSSMGYHVYIYDDKGNEIEHIETPNIKLAERKVSWFRKIDARDRYRKISYNPIELE